MKRSIWTLLLAILLVGIGPATAADGAAVSSGVGAIPASFFGMTTISPTDYPGGGSGDPGVSIGALGKPPNWGWAWNELQPGQFNWSTVDGDLALAEANGVDYFYDLGGTPPWAARDPNSCTTYPAVTICTSPPANIQDWANYVSTLVTRYKGRIKYYEIWNEPNTCKFWSGSYADMVQLARSAYTTIKNIDPNAQVLTPSPTGPLHTVRGVCPTAFTANAPDWMTAYLQAGGAQWADVGAWHGYIGSNGTSPFPMPEQNTSPSCPPETCYGSILAKTHRMREAFDANGMAGKPMFDTEGSWGYTTNLDPTVQPEWLARWYLIQASRFANVNLQRVYWFAWGPPIGGQQWGTLTDGSGNLTAAGVAYNQIYGWLVGSTFTKLCFEVGEAGLWTCDLTEASGINAVAVWSTGAAIQYTAPPGSIQYRDLAGNITPVVAGTAVTVGGSPILFE